MSNMSYCRFENTSRDLADCEDHIFDGDLSSDYEKTGRINLVRSCCSILEGLGCEIRDADGMTICAEDAERLIDEMIEKTGIHDEDDE